MKLLFLWLLAVLCPRLPAQGVPPQAAVKRMALAPNLTAQLVASEPMITQPVCIEFDSRGRLWVIQYIQYPNPAGLQRARIDRWSRTVYDRVPEPPPRGPKGADRITILEDHDGDGAADAAHDFVNGLNLTTGLAFGHGGVFVLNVPYLLFYPDRNHDDQPDSDPEVCLSGFGMDDAHSVANSLTWGPDGWLYGCQGSTVTAQVRGIEFQQGIWRYHPISRKFELFCEGGGNAWGLDFDAEGELIYSTNVGGYRNLHGVQGAFYWKSVGKHGALHNPYAYGHFDHISHTNFLGGHVTVGGLIYRGTNLPAQFQGRFLSADLLGHGVQWHEMYRRGATFTSAHGGYLLEANDPWFAPSDLTVSPDGALYAADWHDPRTAHPDPDAEWDRSNGRVYRIMYHSAVPQNLPEFRTASSSALIDLLANPNPWIVRQAQRALADRRDPQAISPLRQAILQSTRHSLSLQYLWALHLSGAFDPALAAQTLAHPSPSVRKWSVRFLGDSHDLTPALAAQCTQLAATDSDVSVRAQLAASAKRLPAAQAWPILHALLLRDIDASDPFIPLLIWWAIEHHSIPALAPLQQFFSSQAAWQSSLVRYHIIDRLVRRWAAERSPLTLSAATETLKAAPTPIHLNQLLQAIAFGLRDQPDLPVKTGDGGLFAKSSIPHLKNLSAAKPTFLPAEVPESLRALLRSLLRAEINKTNVPLLRVAGLIGMPEARPQIAALAPDPQTPIPLQIELIQLLSQLATPGDEAILLQLLTSASAPPPLNVQLALLDALAQFDSPALTQPLLRHYPQLLPPAKSQLRDLLLSRKPSALILLQAVENQSIPPADFSLDQLRLAALHDDPTLNAIVKKHWGNITRGTPEELLAQMRRFNNDLNAAQGNPQPGRLLFQKTCAPCHQLFGEGNNLGPDLTHANRSDREFLLNSIVDPSAVIRKEHLAFELATSDGRLLTGVILDQSNGQISIGTTTAQRVSIPQSKVISLRESALSLMPSGLLQQLNPQEIRDLFAYLQSPAPNPLKP